MTFYRYFSIVLLIILAFIIFNWTSLTFADIEKDPNILYSNEMPSSDGIKSNGFVILTDEFYRYLCKDGNEIGIAEMEYDYWGMVKVIAGNRSAVNEFVKNYSSESDIQIFYCD